MKIMKKENELYGPSLTTGLTCIHVLCYYWAADYFYSYLNQMLKPLSHSSYNLRIEKLTILIVLLE